MCRKLTFFTAIACVSKLTASVGPDVFLEHVPASSIDMSVELQESLLQEIHQARGSVESEVHALRMHDIETLLRPTFVAMPKNRYGNLGRAGVRYILHRLFVQRHGWFVRGVEPNGAGWNSSSVGGFVEEGLPENVTMLFEEHLDNRGLGVYDIALLVATLESLVHKEAVSKLNAVYQAHHIPSDGAVDVSTVDEVIDSYLASYIIGADVNEMTELKIRKRRRDVVTVYPNWPETQRFARDVRERLTGFRDSLTFADVVLVVAEIGEQYGRWQNSECLALKEELLDLSPARDRANGRVRLSDFYGGALHKGKWHFGESVTYLRQLGALDESDPTDVKVIAANYIHSPSNCLASSAFYSVCCLDQCESLMDNIEAMLQKAEATPSEIVAVAATLASDSASQNSLSASLLSRLDEIAKYHGGSVPLHGRLFAQWMHNAFPHECSYPHMSGTTRPLRADDFQEQTGLPVSASRDEMKQFVEAPLRRKAQLILGSWHFEEELFVSWQVSSAQQQTLATIVRTLVAVLMLTSGTLGLLRTFLPATECFIGFKAPRKRYSV